MVTSSVERSDVAGVTTGHLSLSTFKDPKAKQCQVSRYWCCPAAPPSPSAAEQGDPGCEAVTLQRRQEVGEMAQLLQSVQGETHTGQNASLTPAFSLCICICSAAPCEKGRSGARKAAAAAACPHFYIQCQGVSLLGETLCQGSCC